MLEVAVRHGGNEGAQKHNHDDRVGQNHDLDVLPTAEHTKRAARQGRNQGARRKLNNHIHRIRKDFLGPERRYISGSAQPRVVAVSGRSPQRSGGLLVTRRLQVGALVSEGDVDV